MVQNCLKDRCKPFQQVAQDTGMNISEHVVRDVAADAGYHRCVVRKVPFLTALQKRKRTAWADEYKDFNAQRWGDIIWSDECYIHLNDKSGRVYVTRRANEEYCQEAALTRRTAWRRSRGGVGLGLSGKQLHPATPELTA